MLRFCLTIALSCSFWQVCAALEQDEFSADPLFTDNEIFDVRVVAPLDTVVKDRPIDEYVDAKLYYRSVSGELIELDIGVQTRGRFRRRSDVCHFPPLRLNFKKSQVANTVFENQDKLKLVTHCRTGSHVLEQAVLSEYLAYRILNLLTDLSFRVRLVRIQYANTADHRETDAHAILIEDKDRLANRIGLPLLDVETIGTLKLEPEYLNLTSVFQYFIGNTDFSPRAGAPGDVCCHNHTPFGSDDGPYYSIPYDFDMSGLVAAPYATPNPKLRLDSVQERLYRGLCTNNVLLPATLEKFEAKRDEIEDLIREQAELTGSTRRELLKYISQFYKTIGRTKSVERHFVKRCR